MERRKKGGRERGTEGGLGVHDLEEQDELGKLTW